MKIAAVIAEYNPFHNGHAYQFNKIRQQTHADRILVMMSGDFVQRGAPACIDKYTRCRMALAAGADMVFELPSYGAVGSAEIFAESAVSLLNHLGCIDYLCFGAEMPDIELFHLIARILVDEPAAYKDFLQAALKKGQNFPAARSQALCSFLRDDRCQDMLNQPNNILAIEYMKALYKLKSPIQPFPIKRTGASYHSTDTATPYASATAIRTQLADLSSDIPAAISVLDIPAKLKPMMQDYLMDYPPLMRNDFSDIMASRLLDASVCLTDYTDISADIANRIDDFRYQFISFEQFIALLSAKNLTSARIARCLFHILLNHKRTLFDQWKAQHYSGYLRVLGFRKASSDIWKLFASDCRNQLITRTADANTQLSGVARSIYDADIYASRLYRQILRNRSGKHLSEITTEPVIIWP